MIETLPRATDVGVTPIVELCAAVVRGAGVAQGGPEAAAAGDAPVPTTTSGPRSSATDNPATMGRLNLPRPPARVDPCTALALVIGQHPLSGDYSTRHRADVGCVQQRPGPRRESPWHYNRPRRHSCPAMGPAGDGRSSRPRPPGVG